MERDDRQTSSRIQLYLSPEHPCSYLQARAARTLFVDPAAPLDPSLYQNLLELGFRRSGDHVYRPECSGCRACVPIRLAVAEFRPRRSQRRCWRSNEGRVEVHSRPPGVDPVQFRLYRRYTGLRHPEGGMADADEARYLEFLASGWGDTQFHEFRRDGRLMAVAVTDRLPHALSAVYTFFEPELARYSPGVYSILWQIEEARRLGLRWLYLGYWIGTCGKMSYKERYRPLEAWDGRAWRRFGVGEPIDFAGA